MGAMLVSRLLHPLGMYAASNTLQFRIGRVGGITITFVLLISCAVTILWRAWIGTGGQRTHLNYCNRTIFSLFTLILTL